MSAARPSALPDLATRARARARVVSAVRAWFAEHGYVEVDTPCLVASPAMEEHLYPIAAGDRFLRTSPEFALKALVAAGLPRIVEIGPCFRDREQGPWHRREFTMVEWYRAGAELVDLMDEVRGVVEAAALALGVPAPGPWERRSVRELLIRHGGVDPARASAAELGAPGDSWDEAFFRRWIDRVEPAIDGPMFVEAWPASLAALARVRTDGGWPAACRFEAYLGGVELANAFLELTDGDEQQRRFFAANAARVAAGEAPHPIDPAFLEAVARMPRTAGIALGLDRLVAVLAGWPGIG